MENKKSMKTINESQLRAIVAESIKNVLENSYRDAAKKGDKTSNANKHTLNWLKKRYDKDAPKKFHKFANKYGLDKTTKNASAVSNWEDDCNDSGTPVSKLKESQLRKVVAKSVRKVLKESDFSPFSDEDDFATTNDTRISTPTNRFRVKYFFKKENPNARPNRFGNIPPEEKYINDTEIEEFDNIDEAEKFFNKLCNTWEEGKSPIWVLDVTLERLKDTLVGKYWDNIRSASYNAWRNETR